MKNNPTSVVTLGFSRRQYYIGYYILENIICVLGPMSAAQILYPYTLYIIISYNHREYIYTPTYI